MATSAFLGQPPLSQDDVYIKKAIKALSGTFWFPDPSLPFGSAKPSPNAPDDFNGRGIQAATISLIVIVALITCGRFYLRLYRKRVRLGWDDAFVIPGALTGLFYMGLILWQTSSPEACFGHHIYFCTYSQLNEVVLTGYVVESIFFFGIYCCKISILFLNRRITALTTGPWKKIQYALLFILIVFGLFSFLATTLGCTPVLAHFNLIVLGQTDPSQLHCLPAKVQNNIQIVNRAFHISSDLMLLCIPLFILWQLQMPLRKKIGLGFLFCVGIVCTLASIMRNVVYATLPSDPTYSGNVVYLWDIVDMAFACIVASLPVYYPVLDAMFRKLHYLSQNGWNSRLRSFVGQLHSGSHDQPGPQGSGKPLDGMKAPQSSKIRRTWQRTDSPEVPSFLPTDTQAILRTDEFELNESGPDEERGESLSVTKSAMT